VDPRQSLEVESVRSGDIIRLVVRGELDLATAPLMAQEIEDSCASSPVELVLDLGELRFCDSSGVREVVAAANLCIERSVKFSVIRAQSNVRRIFEIVGLADILEDEGGTTET
jgi:anti-sigma B factor antagonist